MPAEQAVADEGMESSVYSDAETENQDEKEPDDVEATEEDESQTLVSKAMLPKGCKEGDTYTFKVVADYGEEVGVKLVEKEDEETETETPSVEDQEIESMDTED